MISCPSCGQSNPEGFRLCGMCGASLAAETVAREELKVVTVLFCDLVGFTAKAEQLDPEDDRAVLGPTTSASAASSNGTVTQWRSSSAMR